VSVLSIRQRRQKYIAVVPSWTKSQQFFDWLDATFLLIVMYLFMVSGD
jgi:hypothetical protein